MPTRTSPKSLDFQSGANLYFALIAVLFLFLASGVVSYINTRALNRTADLIAQTHENLLALNDVLSLLKDAETGQRGFLLTGDGQYLDPYSSALIRIYSRLGEVDQLTREFPNEQARLIALRSAIDVKLKELEETISIRKNHGFDAALAVVATDRGKVAMDEIRANITAMQEAEGLRRAERLKSRDVAYKVAVGSGILTGIVGGLLSGFVTYLLRRVMLNRQLQDWLNTGQIRLGKVMVVDQRLDRLGDNVLQCLAEYLNAQAGAFFAKEPGNRYRRIATYGVPASGGTPELLEAKDGLLGQACKDRRTFIIDDVPDGYLYMGSSLGISKPRHLLIVPVTAEEEVNGVIELGFVQSLDDSVTDLFQRVSDSIGIAIRSANDRIRLQNLLDEMQRQTEELQTQGEELRVSNEELEERGRVLKESQTRLELQKVELEQTNSQLEEQTQLLESQRNEATQARASLQTQARALERASQFKSDFLANMSHELRTPLNSSLILAKLLADNSQGNLTAEQVKYAETIRSAGNDLLALINDVLDLSKIEAGHLEMRPERFPLKQLMDDLGRTFHHVAVQKGLTFRMSVLPGCPDELVTDMQRLEQVLKNVLSNAMKFTEKGEVSITVGEAGSGQVSFTVTDTGIGIAEHQQQVIFEAFRQADGTTNRKYGGTGLGLSISRELTRRLGGEISLTSEVGRGSTFTVTIPVTYEATRVVARAVATLPLPVKLNPVAMNASASPPESVCQVNDDRAKLTSDRRVILVVEDDESFAGVLYDLAHELDFQCLIATTAEDGLVLATQYLPSAVVLDVGLPDQSGLAVLDRLKHDSRTRHIPVHVVSGGDYAQTALSLGAVGYMPKPVQREDLVEALQRLETRLAQRMRRILLVEDDPVQLESLQKLLGSQDVETVGVRTATECLERLKGTTFDCMVLDLSLPDASGYTLLETLSREETYSFPPVIVYTGRDLSAAEEQQLRRYSKSIIIKGAKSPERLLDEVTLFLHQVVSDLPPEQQRMLEKARSRDAAIEGRRILVVEDDVRNVFALTSILEPRGAILKIARNGREALDVLRASLNQSGETVDLVLMDVMMPEMDGITATSEIRKMPEFKKLPVIMLTAKAMSDDQTRCLEAGANDYMAKPLDVEKLLSLVRVWMPR